MLNLTEIDYPVYLSPVKKGLFCVYLAHQGFSAGGPVPTPPPYPNEGLISHFNALEGYNSELNLYGYLVSPSTPPEQLEVILNSQAPIPSDLMFYVADCYPEGNKSKFETRVIRIRVAVNNIADYKKIIDLYTVLVHTPYEIKEYYKEFLEEGDVGYTLRTPDNLAGEVLLKVTNG